MKKILTMGLVLLMSINFLACKSSDSNAEAVETQASTQATTQASTEASKSTKDIVKDYTDDLNMLNDKTFSMDIEYVNKGYQGSTQPVIDSEDGCLYWELIDNCLVTAMYEADSNTLTLTTSTIDDSGNIESVSFYTLNDFLTVADEINITISNLNINNKNIIMIESRSIVYTYADGVEYGIELIELSDDGTLTHIFSDKIAGSGSEDITQTIREGFNKTTSLNCSKDEFEDAFYDGNMLSDNLNCSKKACVEFISNAAKTYNTTNDINILYETQRKLSSFDPIEGWGEGSFKNYCN